MNFEDFWLVTHTFPFLEEKILVKVHFVFVFLDSPCTLLSVGGNFSSGGGEGILLVGRHFSPLVLSYSTVLML